MTVFATVVYYLLRILWLLLIVRITVEMIHSFGRSWSPGPKLAAVLEVVFRATVWCLVPIRKVLRPVGIGGVGLDFSPIIVFLVVSVLVSLTVNLGATPVTLGSLFS